MPDWTYQTIFRPCLSRLPYPLAQRLAFGLLGHVGASGAGRFLIRMLGHAEPPPQIALRRGQWQLPSPVALGCGINQESRAIAALGHLGFGLIEVGPIAPCAPLPSILPESSRRTELRAGGVAADWRTPGRSIWLEHTATVSTDHMLRQLRRSARATAVPILVRVRLEPDDRKPGDRKPGESLSAGEPAEQLLTQTLSRLATVCDGFSVQLFDDAEQSSDPAARTQQTVESLPGQAGPASVSQELLDRVIQLVTWRSDMLWLLHVPVTIPQQSLDQLVVACSASGNCAIVLSCGAQSVCPPLLQQIQDQLQCIARIAALQGAHVLTGVHAAIREPVDALRLHQCGASILLVDQGLIESGPGLPKRINAVLRAQQLANAVEFEARSRRFERRPRISLVHQSWCWLLVLATALLIGGGLALWLGLGRVLLPYDEQFLGMLREEICSLNARLLPFMSHDRVTLAGTMLALGSLYLALAWYGDRQGHHWAGVAVLTSAFVGFLSFFLFLGFGYFDPFHAFVTCILFQFLTIALRSHRMPQVRAEFDLENSSSWRRALWGQLLLVVHGAGVLAGGLVICLFGISNVFVQEDLEYMQTTAAILEAANPRLVPLVAHDRASFGGMLISSGLAVLCSALWGWQRGRRWLWIAMAISGTTGYGMTLAIHWMVGYTSWIHLLPAYAGLAALWATLALSHEWMFENAGRSDTMTD